MSSLLSDIIYSRSDKESSNLEFIIVSACLVGGFLILFAFIFICGHYVETKEMKGEKPCCA